MWDFFFWGGGGWEATLPTRNYFQFNPYSPSKETHHHQFKSIHIYKNCITETKQLP